MATKPKTPLAAARKVFDIELAGLRAVRAQLDGAFVAAVEALCDALSQRGKLVVVGIGKSGNIGQKIVATFNSTASAPHSTASAICRASTTKSFRNKGKSTAARICRRYSGEP